MNVFVNAYADAIISNIRLAVLDSKCTITWVNDKFCKLTKYEKHELIGKPISKLNLVCMREDDFRAIQSVISRGESWSGEIKSMTKDGSILWVKTNILPVRNENGTIESYLILSSNITTTKNALNEKNEALESLMRSEARYRAVVDNQPDFMSLCNAEGVRLFVNDRYCEFIGKDQPSLIGTNIIEYPLPGIPLHFVKKIFQLSIDNPEISDVFELPNANGIKVWISLSIRGIFNESGQLYEILTIGRDVSAIKMAEMRMSKYVDDIERIAFMTSHKVRAPIATMLGLVELLKLNAIHTDQWSDVLNHFKDCIRNLDLCTRELGAFINQRQLPDEKDIDDRLNVRSA
ncbi:MAG: PAS domain-containing protein [Chryseolinea sp.]